MTGKFDAKRGVMACAMQGIKLQDQKSVTGVGGGGVWKELDKLKAINGCIGTCIID